MIFRSWLRLGFWLVLSLVFLGVPNLDLVHAATYYWVGGTTNSNINNPANWNTIAGSCANSANLNVPGIDDDVYFVSNCNSAATINVAWSVNNLYINSGHTAAVTLAASLTATSTLQISAGTLALAAYNADVGTTTLIGGTISGVGGGIMTANAYDVRSGTISAILAGTDATVTKSTSGTVNLSGANTFGGGLVILAGTIQFSTSASALGGSGTGTVTLGNSAGGSNNATLVANSSLTFANPIVLASNTTGTLTIRNNGNYNPTFTGGVTGNNNLVLYASGSSGGMNINFTTNDIDITGTITNAGTATNNGGPKINSNISANVTEVIQNSATSPMYIYGDNAFGNLTVLKGSVYGGTNASAFGSGSITLGDESGGNDNASIAAAQSETITFTNPIILASNTTGILTVYSYTGVKTFTGGITGNNDVVINKNSSSGGEYLIFSEGEINNNGTVTLTGTYANPRIHIYSLFGNNVTNLIKNGAIPAIISGNNSNIGGDVIINAGTLTLLSTTTINVAGDWTNSGTFTANQSTVNFTSGTHAINGTSTFYNLSLEPNNTVTFSATSTQTISNNFSCTGTAGNYITINSSAAGLPGTLSKSSGTVSCDYLLLTDSAASGGATWNAGSNSIGYTGVTGWTGFMTYADPPTDLSATVGNTQIILSWSAPIDNGGAEITDYVVDYKLATDESWTTFADGVSTATTSTVTGLTNGLLYNFRVSAVNVAGQGSASDTTNATPATIPNAPTDVTAESGNAQAIVSFSAPADDGGSVITGYTVTSSPGSHTGTGSSSPITVTGLTNGTEYTFTVTATNAIGTGPASTPSATTTPATVPDAPTSLQATAGAGQVTLTWSAPVWNGGAAVSDYVVDYKETAEESWTTFADGVSTTASTTVTGLTNGTSYDFRVSAANSAGQGSASDTAIATPVTIPGAPTNASATRGNAQASVSFSAPADNGGSVITGYTVTSDPDSHTGTGAASPITVTGLTNGTSYTFTVTATNAVGTGPASEASNAVTPATIPNAPIGVSAEGGNAEATVSFSAPVDNGGDAIINYYAAASPGGAVGTASSSPITVTGLTPGATYTFTVTAENTVGIGASSTASGAVTLPTVPGAPINLAATVLGSSIALAWSAPADNGGAAITDYVIEYQLSVGGEWAVFADGTNASTTVTVTGLANDNSYDFRVSAVNLVGQGSASATTSATPGEPAQVIINSLTNLIVPTITASVRLTNEGSANYEYQYTWCVTDASDNYCGGGDDVTSASAAKLINAGDDFDTTLSATVATPGDYWFHLSVTYGSETSTASQSFTAIAGVPDAPTDITAEAGNGQVVVSFTASASDHGSTITGYTATANPGGVTGTGNSSPLTVTGLTNGTGYTFTVTATNAIGTSAASAPSATATPIGVPAAPTNLSATAGDGSVSLAWTAPSNHGGATTTDYIVEYKLSSAATWSVFADGESATESTTVTGLSAGTSYDFRISAVNTAGQGDPSATASATTESEAVAIASGSSSASGWINLWQTITEIIRPTPTIGPAIPTEDTATVVASDQNQTSPSSISTGQSDESATEFGSAETGIVRFVAETKPATEDQPFQLDSKFKIIIVVVSIMLLLAGLWRLVFPFFFSPK